MKKKLLSTLLCLTMIMSLAACGTKEEPTSTTDPIVEESIIETTTDTTNLVEDVETSEEIKSDTQPTEDESEIHEDVEYSIDDLKSAVPTDNFKVSADTSGISMTVAKSGSDSQISISCSLDNVSAFMDMYNIGSDMYSYFDDGNGNVNYYHAVKESETQEDTSLAMSDNSFNTDFDSIVSVEYIETKTYDGETYDVVRVGTSTMQVSEGTTLEINGVVVEEDDMIIYSDYYINTDTKMLDYIFATDSMTGEVTVGKFELIDRITLPSDFTEDVIQEVTSEDMAGQLFGVIMMMAGSAYENNTEITE